MNRRDFISLVSGAAGMWPLSVYAQQSERGKRVGVLNAYVESDVETQAHMKVFREQLRQLGWTQDRNVQIDYRWTGGDPARIRPLAKELVSLRPDVIIGRSTPVAAALLQETRTIPIVFVNVSDPVGDGLVQSVARPGGNATGFTSVEASLAGKWLGLLKELTPHVTRIGVMYNPQTAGGSGGLYYLKLVKDASASIGVQTVAMPIQNAAEIDSAIAAFTREPNGVMQVLPDITTTVHRVSIIALAAGYRLPTMYPYRFFVQDGGLMSYGVNLADLYRQATSYVDRILRGAKPSELPVQQPTRFELIINRKTATALGLTIPDRMVAIADEVIE